VSGNEATSAYGTLATFTVCADNDLSSIVRSASAKVPGVEYSGEFQDYITADRRPHFPPAIKRADCCVAFVDFDLHPQYAIETVEALRSHRTPQIISVGVASKLDTDLLVRAMRAGCSEFLEKPLPVARLQETLQRIQDRLQASRATPARCGLVITFLGAKGGVGTTALAVHVAIALASKHGKKTLLVDHHHQLGHVCLYLGIKQSQYHFDELIRNVLRLDSDLFKGFVIKHSSGLDVLASPNACAPQYSSSREDLERVIDFLREEYQFILIDSSIADDHIARALVQFSDEVALVCTPDLSALRDTSRHIDHLSLDDATSTKLRIILNRRSPNDGFTNEQITKVVRLPIACTISSSPAELRHAINQGEPVSAEKRSEFAAQIGEWANRLALLAEPASVPAEKTSKRTFAFWK
jgi:pilus assembly protein CpaE